MRKLAFIVFAVFALTAAPAAAQVTATFEAESDRSFGNPDDLVLSPILDPRRTTTALGF